MAKRMKIVILILFFLFTISSVVSTSCVDQSTNNSVVVSISQLDAMYDCNDGASSMDCAIACFEAAIAQALSYPSAIYDIRALVEYCFLNYQLQAAMVNGLGITVAAGFNNTDECSSSRVGSNDQISMDHVPIRQYGGRRMMRSEVDKRRPAPPAGDFGRGAPNWNETTGG